MLNIYKIKKIIRTNSISFINKKKKKVKKYNIRVKSYNTIVFIILIMFNILYSSKEVKAISNEVNKNSINNIQNYLEKEDYNYIKRINNYINGDKVVELNNYLYVTNNSVIQKVSQDLYIKENIVNTEGALRIYELNNKIYYLVNDGIKIFNENREDEYLYKSDNFKSEYCQLINNKFYFVEYGVYIEWTLGTSSVIEPSLNETNALRSIDIDGKNLKTYYYNDVKPVVDDNGIIEMEVERKVISIDNGQRFLIIGNNVYTRDRIYNLILMDQTISFITILSEINFDYIIGYYNDRFYCSGYDKFYEMTLSGNFTLIDEVCINSMFYNKGNVYAVGIYDSIYRLTNSTLSNIGYISGINNVYSIGEKVYSLDKTFTLMNINLDGNNVGEMTTANIINANNKKGSIARNFAYDSDYIYVVNDGSIEKWTKDLSKKDILQNNNDSKKDLQKYNDLLIYNTGNEIKQININNVTETLYSSEYLIHEIQEDGGYVYFSETTGYYSRIGRVNISTKKIEYLINNIGWGNDYGNIDYVAKSFIVLNDKIYFNVNNNKYEVYCYYIKLGFSKKIDGISDIRNIKYLEKDNICINKENNLIVYNLTTEKEIVLCEENTIYFDRVFRFKDKFYVIQGYDEILEILDGKVKSLGYIRGINNVYSIGDKLYSSDNTFTLMSINLDGSNVNGMTTSNVVNANNKHKLIYENFTYDEDYIYVGNDGLIEKWKKDLSQKYILQLNNDIKKDLQKYDNLLIYNTRKEIKQMNINGDTETLYASEYLIHKIQEDGGYVYFSETYGYYTRIGRINILTKNIEYLINDIGWKNNDGNSNYISKSFIVLNDRIYYNVNNNNYEVYCYYISSGISKKFNGISDISSIKLLTKDKIYYSNNNILYCTDLSYNIEKKYVISDLSINSFFEDKDNIYIVDYDKNIYKVEENIKKLGYINADSSIISDGDNLYNISYNNVNQINLFIDNVSSNGLNIISMQGRTITVEVENKIVANEIVGQDGRANIKLKNVNIGDYIRVFVDEYNGVISPYIEIKIDEIQYENEDINKDGVIDILDLALTGIYYNKTIDDVNWNYDMDINNDYIIDIFDLVLISKKI